MSRAPFQPIVGTEYASVSDESSPDSRITGHAKVPVFAQVTADQPLGWFYDLRAAYPHVPGELKGAVVAAQLSSLAPDLRRRVLAGLRGVRIHLTDPRPYLTERDDIYRKAIGVPFPAGELRERAKRGDKIARYLLEAGDDLVGRRILMDSRPVRLAERIVVVEQVSGLRMRAVDTAAPMGLDIRAQLSAIRSKRQSLVTRAAALATKAGPVFSHALDEAFVYRDEDLRFNWASSLYRRVAARLRDLHAFDQGDEAVLGRVQAMRDLVGKAIEELMDPFAGSERFAIASGVGGSYGEPIPTVVSADVVQAQAADIAARFAVLTYEREGLVGVTRAFDYVVFNGIRVSERTATASTMRS